MDRKRFSFGMQFGLVLRYTLRNVSLLLLMALLLAGALYPQIPIFRSGMDLGHKILLALIELAVAGFLLYVVWINLVDAFIAYSDFRYHVAKTTRNQNWLREFVEKETDENIRDAAVARISDPDELIAIALQDASHVVRRTAAGRLQNAKNAEELIARSKDDSVRAEAVRWIKNESILMELARNDSNSWTRVSAARNINSTENLLTLLCVTKDSEVWESCLPQLMKQTIQNGKLAVEIVTKLKAAPLGNDWLKKTVCPSCYHSEYRVDTREGSSEMVYCASDNVVYEYHTITFIVCESCGHEEGDAFFVPLSSFFPDEAK